MTEARLKGPALRSHGVAGTGNPQTENRLVVVGAGNGAQDEP